VNALPVFRINLRRARLLKGLTQETIAERAGLAAQHYQDIEAGRRPDIMLSTIERISAAVEEDIATLLTPDAIPEPLRKRGRAAFRIVR